jgi:hypothetical protein
MAFTSQDLDSFNQHDFAGPGTGIGAGEPRAYPPAVIPHPIHQHSRQVNNLTDP